jgi:hypothetical protein
MVRKTLSMTLKSDRPVQNCKFQRRPRAEPFHTSLWPSAVAAVGDHDTVTKKKAPLRPWPRIEIPAQGQQLFHSPVCPKRIGPD